MFAYVFLVGFDEDGPHADCFLDVSALVGSDLGQYMASIQAARRLGLDTKPRENALTNLNGVRLRARVTGKRMHKVTTEVPITGDELDALLLSKQSERTLKKFLKESAI
jgi:hypothetical protein